MKHMEKSCDMGVTRLREKNHTLLLSGNELQIQVNQKFLFLNRIVTLRLKHPSEIHKNQKEYLWIVTLGKTGVTRKNLNLIIL